VHENEAPECRRLALLAEAARRALAIDVFGQA
jgi:hypothetical protein